MTGPELIRTALLMLILAFLVESMVEAILGKLFELLNMESAKPWLFYVALVAGVLLANWYSIDAIAYLVGLEPSAVGIQLTGLVVGRGAAYTHDFFSRFKKDVAMSKFYNSLKG